MAVDSLPHTWSRPRTWALTAHADWLWLLALPLLMLLVVPILRGHYVADDYCYAGRAISLGWPGAQTHWYLTWSGRFTYTAVASLLAFAGEWLTRVLPPLLLIGWIASLYYAVTPIIAHRRMAGVAALALGTLALLSTSSALDDVSVWFTGTLTYVLPLILLSIYTGWTLRVPTRARLIASAAILLVAASFNETHAAIQTTACVLAYGSSYIVPSQRARRGWYLVGVVASLAALVIVAAAPGNAVRQEQAIYPPVPSGLAIPITVIKWSLYGLVVWGLMSPLYLVGALLVGWLMRSALPSSSSRTSLILLVGCAILWAAGIAPSALMFGFVPYEHSMLFLMAIYVLAMALIGTLLPRRLDTMLARVAAPLLITVALIGLVQAAQTWGYFDPPVNPVQWIQDCTAVYHGSL